MVSKPNQILIGIIIILLGIFALIQNVIRINYIFLAVTVCGFALLLLYKTKRKSWSLFFGCYMFIFGFYGILSNLKFIEPSGFLFAGLLFLIPGLVFIILYYSKNKRGLLLPASFLIWFGLYIMSFSIHLFQSISGGMFFVYIGMSFISVYLIEKHFLSKFTLYFGTLFIGLGVLILVGFSGGISVILNTPKMLSGIIIVIGVLTILKALRKK